MNLITLGIMPPSPDAVGTVYEYGGLAPERLFGVVGLGYDKPTIQVLFRGNPFDYTGPRAMAEKAYRALMAVQPGPLCAGVSTIYHTIDPVQAPFTMGVDVNNRYKIACNFYIKREA